MTRNVEIRFSHEIESKLFLSGHQAVTHNEDFRDSKIRIQIVSK